jgi:hypothetical protein
VVAVHGYVANANAKVRCCCSRVRTLGTGKRRLKWGDEDILNWVVGDRHRFLAFQHFGCWQFWSDVLVNRDLASHGFITRYLSSEIVLMPLYSS